MTTMVQILVTNTTHNGRITITKMCNAAKSEQCMNTPCNKCVFSNKDHAKKVIDLLVNDYEIYSNINKVT